MGERVLKAVDHECRRCKSMDINGTSRCRFLIASAASALAPSCWSAWAVQTANPPAAIAPFTFKAADAALKDLRRRLDQTRWPERETGAGWEQGPPLSSMRNLVDYWRGCVAPISSSSISSCVSKRARSNSKMNFLTTGSKARYQLRTTARPVRKNRTKRSQKLAISVRQLHRPLSVAREQG
jgi:hypothetical protein